MWRMKFAAVWAMLWCGVSWGHAQSFGYANSMLPGMNPDPSVCRAGEDYYLVASSFVQYPGLPVYHSRDLIHWELVGYCCREEGLLRDALLCGRAALERFGHDGFRFPVRRIFRCLGRSVCFSGRTKGREGRV